MKSVTILNLLLGFLLAGSPVVADNVGSLASGNKMSDKQDRSISSIQLQASATDAISAATSNFLALTSVATNALPPLPSGVTELKFSEFFRQPIGPRGLEFTDQLRSLEGRRIRILGYMVRQDKPADGCFLLSPLPMTLHEAEYGLCDDLPATTLHVLTPAEALQKTPFTPGMLLLTGRLSIGNRQESDGRTSTVRLLLDPPTPEQKAAAEQAASTTSKRSSAGHGHAH